MTAAYDIALDKFHVDTNHEYCISANITTDFGSPAWSFVFCSTNATPRDSILVVRFNGETFEDNGFR